MANGDGKPHLTSQGSVVLATGGRHLLATNAASDDLSLFAVADDGSVALLDRVHAGSAPKSVTERDALVVVLGTGKPGISSFRVHDGGLAPVPGDDQALAASDADPAQVSFSPDGSLIAITQRGTDSIATCEVRADGTFGTPRTIASQGPTPYGFAFTSGGNLVVTEAFRAEHGAAAASSYALVDGSLAPRSGSVGNGRSEICWGTSRASTRGPKPTSACCSTPAR